MIFNNDDFSATGLWFVSNNDLNFSEGKFSEFFLTSSFDYAICLSVIKPGVEAGCIKKVSFIKDVKLFNGENEEDLASVQKYIQAKNAADFWKNFDINRFAEEEFFNGFYKKENFETPDLKKEQFYEILKKCGFDGYVFSENCREKFDRQFLENHKTLCIFDDSLLNFENCLSGQEIFDSQEFLKLKAAEKKYFKEKYKKNGKNRSSENYLEKLQRTSEKGWGTNLSVLLTENEIKSCFANEYGLKIFNYEAASIFSVNNGTKDKYHETKAIFANNLFSDFLKDNGLNTYKIDKKTDDGYKWKIDPNGKWTRDIICIKFSYGVKKDESNNQTTVKSVEDLRIQFYTNKDENGNDYKVVIKYPEEEIEYKMLYRTSGKAKEGSCMFINANLYEKAKKFLRMGKKNLEDETKIIEIGAYQSLVASNIVGKVKINPENILVIKDIDSCFERETVSFWDLLDKTNLLSAEESKKYKKADKNSKKKNTLFDGQALIDTSVFDSSYFFSDEEKLNGYILLRQHFFKAAAFCTDIKQFFKDYCAEHGKNYETFTVKDFWDKEHNVKDIELITTENAMKWMKFKQLNFNNWSNQVAKNGCFFGIVKTAHKSKRGDYQRMSYQMVNALENDKVLLNKVVQCSLDYVNKLLESDNEFVTGKKDIEENEFIKFLERNKTYSNDYEVLVELCKKNRYFLRNEYFRDRKKHIIFDYKKELKSGHIIQVAENLVIVGSPYAMLLASAGEDPLIDPMFEVEKTENPAIQCYTERFADGEELAEFRSPFNSRNNLGYLRNKYPSEKIRKYFNRFGQQIIAVNMVGTDFQARNNGSDQDSDSIYTTNSPAIVDCAKRYYQAYPTIINDIEESSGKEDCKVSDSVDIYRKYAEKDNMLAKAKAEIGLASNEAQLFLTHSYNNEKQKEEFEDYVCILSVLAQIAIDKAKRNFDVPENLTRKIGKKLSSCKYPVFWQVLAKEKKDISDIDENLSCPMNFVYKDWEIPKKQNRDGMTLDMNDFFIPFSRKASNQIRDMEDLISDYANELEKFNSGENSDDGKETFLLLRAEFEELLDNIRKKNFSPKQIFPVLIDRAFCISSGMIRNENSMKNKTDRNKSLLLKILYEIDPKALLACFKTESEMSLDIISKI